MSLHEFFNPLIVFVKQLLDVASYTVALGVIVQLIPVGAGTLSMVWLSLQIFTWFRRKGWQTDAEKERDA